jgi:hypothetical protein
MSAQLWILTVFGLLFSYISQIQPQWTEILPPFAPYSLFLFRRRHGDEDDESSPLKVVGNGLCNGLMR